MQNDVKDDEVRAKKFLEKLFQEKPKVKDTVHRFSKFLYEADDIVEIVLKSHLMIEEALTRIISKYVLYPDFIDEAGLTFWQKVNVARSISLDDSENSMWLLVAGYNKLRNDYGHSLEPPKAQEHIKALRDRYFAELPAKVAKDEELPDEQLLKDIAMFVLGFLGSFEEEVERFRRWTDILDRFVNPHRHQTKNEPSTA